MAVIDVVHVPFKGIPEALAETLPPVQFFHGADRQLGELREDGRLLGLGVSSLQRDPLLPEGDGGRGRLGGYQSDWWFGC